MPFVDATLEGLKLRMAIASPSGCGKTFSSLRVASAMTQVIGGDVYVICAEKGRAKLYSKFFEFKVDDFSDVGRDYGPLVYVRKIQECEKLASVLIIDGISPAWAGPGGALELVDNAAVKQKGNKYVSWRHVTPQHNALVEAMLACECHLIATMRMKDEYVLVEKNGKMVPEKVGLEMIQRNGIEYEFDIVAQMDRDHNMWFTKTRCFELDDKNFYKPGEDLAAMLLTWLDESPGADQKGAEENQPPPTPASPLPPPQETTPPPDEPELTVSILLDRIPEGLSKLGVPDDLLADAIEAAAIAITGKWGVGAIDDIPDTDAAALRHYMRGEMLERLHEFFPKKAS